MRTVSAQADTEAATAEWRDQGYTRQAAGQKGTTEQTGSCLCKGLPV